MALHTRRRYLRLVGVTAATGVGGCNDRGTRTEPRESDPPESESRKTDLVLRAIDEEKLDAGGIQVTVFPSPLQEWLVRAATGDTVVRDHAQVYPAGQFVPPDRLPLARPEYAHLESDGNRIDISDQPFRLTVETGLGTQVTFRAERTDNRPDDRPIVDVDTLAEGKRTYAVELIDAGNITLRPEDEVAEWLRTRVDTYLRYEGHYYDVSKSTPTDDGFIEGIVYFVIDLTRTSTTDGETPVTLRLPAIEFGTRQLVEIALKNRVNDVGRYSTRELPRDVVRFAESTDFLMTYADLYRVSVD